MSGKDFTKFVYDIDPAIQALIGGRPIQQPGEPDGPDKKKRKQEREREKARQRLPRRVSWDLPVALKQEVGRMAAEYQVPVSQVAALLLLIGLEKMKQENLTLEQFLKRGSSPRYPWVIDLTLLKK